MSSKVKEPEFPKSITTLRKEKSLSADHVFATLKDIEGKLLTVVDATFSEKVQREAMKSLMRNALYDDYRKLEDWVFSQTNENVSNFPFYARETQQLSK